MDIDYDIIIAGGGIAGSSLGLVASREGARVLIVEAEREFRDRVRGESLHPWGVAEAERLGVLELIRDAPAHATKHWDTHLGGFLVERKLLTETSAARVPGYNVHHPELETTLLRAAELAGAQLRRGTRVLRMEPGERVSVELSDGVRCGASLGVIADGRHSPLRKQLGIELHAELSPLVTTGVLLEGVSCDRSAVSVFVEASGRGLALLVPLARERVRLYLVEARSSGRQRYSGPTQLQPLLERCMALGVPAASLSTALAIGPLATFDTTCFARRDGVLPAGVALVGDAAGNVDPAFGCGQSLVLRDVRTLLEAFRACGDWQLAAARFAEQRLVYHAALLRLEAWMTRILFTPSPQGDALRMLTAPRLVELGIDLVGAGPDSPTDAASEARLFEGLV